MAVINNTPMIAGGGASGGMTPENILAGSHINVTTQGNNAEINFSPYTDGENTFKTENTTAAPIRIVGLTPAIIQAFGTRIKFGLKNFTGAVELEKISPMSYTATYLLLSAKTAILTQVTLGIDQLSVNIESAIQIELTSMKITDIISTCANIGVTTIQRI